MSNGTDTVRSMLIKIHFFISGNYQARMKKVS